MTHTRTLPHLRRTELPTYRRVVAQVTGGLDGVLRVVALLRGRDYQYHVRDLAVLMRDGVAVSDGHATVGLTSPQASLLLARLHRVPAVVDAQTI